MGAIGVLHCSRLVDGVPHTFAGKQVTRHCTALKMTVPPSERIFVTGISGSGKTTTIADIYLARTQRYIVLDQTGEWQGQTDAYCLTLDDVYQTVRQLSRRGRFRIAYSPADNRFNDLVRWLVPMPDLTRSPVRMLGGLTLVVDEADVVGRFNPSLLDLARRSRHTGLTIIAATQRPANVSRELTAQCRQIIAHRLTEPRDRDYIIDAMRWDQAQADRWHHWTQRYPFGCVWKQTLTGQMMYLTRQKR